jgi:hypothetical protein
MIRENDGEDFEYGGDGDTLANILDPGDNFAVSAMPGNDEGCLPVFLPACEIPSYGGIHV